MRRKDKALDSSVPEIDNCCEKETYAFYGFAAYCSQLVEHAAINLALVLQLPEVNLISKEAFDEIYDSLNKKTFGQLLKTAKKLITISDNNESLLKEALEARNYLAHHFFKEHAENFISNTGKHEMKKELQSIITKLNKADVLLTEIYTPLWVKYGITEEVIENDYNKLLKRAEARDKIA